MADINWSHAGATIGGTDAPTVAGSGLTKPGASAWNSFGFAGSQGFSGDGYFEVTLLAAGTIQIGLATVAPTAAPHWSLVTNDFMLEATAATDWTVFEDGASEGVKSTNNPTATDTMKVAVESGVVKYYVNGSLIYTSAVTPDDGTLFFPVVIINTQNAGVTDAKLVDVSALTDGAVATFTLQAYMNSTWNDVSDVVAKFGIQLRYGLGGAGIRDRVATTGVMSFVLDNSEANATGKVGLYSPGHANIWTVGSDTFDLGTQIRLKVVYGALIYYKFRGWIDDLDIVAGKYTIGGKKVKVTVTDWMDQAARASVSGLTVQQNKRSDEIFSTIVTAMNTAPAAQQVGYGQDTYPYSLDNSRDESFSVMSEFTRLAMSEFGFIFVKGDNVQGGTLVFENRLKRGQKTSAIANLNDLNLIELPVSYGRDDILNNIQVQIFPRRIDTSATTVLFTLQNTPEILVGTTLTIKGTYRDPASGAKTRVGGIEMVTPVITTDYEFTENADGTGNDYSAQLSIVATYAGNSVTLVITNNGPADGFLFLMQTRGKGIYAFESVLFEKSDSASQTKYGDNIVRISMPYQGDSVLGEEVAHYVLSQNKNAATRVLGATFVANDSDANMLHTIQREISDRIAIEEPITAINTEYFINGIEWDISPGSIVRCAWTLAPASLQEYWILEINGFTELDETTVLAYGLFSPQWQLDVSQLGVDTTVNAA